jgi:hypothetical protein
MKTFKYLCLSILSLTFITSCSSDDNDPIPVNEEEVITTLTVVLTPVGTGTPVTLVSRDLDGDGPDAPEFTISGPMSANTTYTGSLDLLNETVSPAESITEEIEEEDDEHQFFFSVTNNLFDVSYADSDGDGNPVGLSFTLNTNSTIDTGAFTITLRHEPNKTAEGVSLGDITNAGGETDVLITFNVSVQ